MISNKGERLSMVQRLISERMALLENKLLGEEDIALLAAEVRSAIKTLMTLKETETEIKVSMRKMA